MKTYISKIVFTVMILIFVSVTGVFAYSLFRSNETYKSVTVNRKTMKAHVKD